MPIVDDDDDSEVWKCAGAVQRPNGRAAARQAVAVGFQMSEASVQNNLLMISAASVCNEIFKIPKLLCQPKISSPKQIHR